MVRLWKTIWVTNISSACVIIQACCVENYMWWQCIVWLVWYQCVCCWQTGLTIVIKLMDQDQGDYREESHVNLITLPTELLIYIISFLSLVRDRIILRHVSRWFKVVIEETPSLWKKLVCDTRNECCSVKEVLKVYGQHIKYYSFLTVEYQQHW